MTGDPLLHRALELLTDGHRLYGDDRGGGAPPPMTELADLQRRAERLIDSTVGDGMDSVRPRVGQLTDALRGTAGVDLQMQTVLSSAYRDHRLGRQATLAVLDDAHGDSAPAADTPLGRREALRRMSGRLRTQRSHIDQSHRHSRVLGQRAGQLRYGHRRHRLPAGHSPAWRPLPLHELKYDKSYARGRIRQRVAAALDELGITDPTARRNWMRGYQTLITRESDGRAYALASAPAAAPGAVAADGHGLGFPRGITQTTPATFAHFHQPGTSTNIYDPVANICASINYVMHRYGVSPDGSNLTALVQQADARRPPKGY